MPKLKPFGIGDVEDMINAENSFNTEVVPKGVYQAKVKRMKHATIQKEGPNKGKSRFWILMEVVGPKSTPKKYIGASISHNINVIESGAGFCNDFLNALAGPEPAKQAALKRAFWAADIVVDSDGHVMKIGKKRVNGDGNGELVVTVKTKLGKDTRSGDPQAQVDKFLVPQANDDDDDDDLDEDLEDDDDLADVDEDEDDVDEDEDDEDDVDEEDSDDEDDEDDEDEDDEDDEDEDDEDEEEDGESDSRRAELEALTIAKLRVEAKRVGVPPATIKGQSKDELIDTIIDAEADSDGEDDPF
ncbi:hypothetical protein SEA_PENELOPE2018_60 [Mycobacterium phage Penelope2018]|uniref:Rho termination factor N-terminal domain-containing protein n=1 Tax=Mycobacterium phage Penelope2018 TaxID=2596982 RepID=A0A5B8RR14_9CAUD|nr:hypothetical protein SEA_PENELOPE2018_60 [Mycobacterium phage Penelope2018]